MLAELTRDMEVVEVDDWPCLAASHGHLISHKQKGAKILTHVRYLNAGILAAVALQVWIRKEGEAHSPVSR